MNTTDRSENPSGSLRWLWRQVRRLFGRAKPSGPTEVIFLTHMPYRWKIGQIVNVGGNLWAIREIEEIEPTGLIGGGAVKCWCVKGSPV